MKIAFLFPGQGSQYVGMGKDIYEQYEEARKIYKKASEILNIDIKKLCFETESKELDKTENTQIAIAVTSLAVLAVLKKYNIEADICSGLSLGEYIALIYSGALTLEDGLNLLKKRGYFMANYIPKEEFAMAAVIGLDSKIIEEECNKLQKEGLFVYIANYNYSMQIVVSGNKKAVEKVSVRLKELGAKRVIPLNTSGPFHTKKLEKAKKMYEKELEKINFNNPKRIVIKNLDGKPYSKNDNKKEILSNHIVSPVRFDKTIKNMKENGVDTFVEIGPGRTLTGFIKKELKDSEINCYTTENLSELSKAIEKLA